MNNENNSKSSKEVMDESQNDLKSLKNQPDEYKKHQSEVAIEDEEDINKEVIQKKKKFNEISQVQSHLKVKDEANKNYNHSMKINENQSEVVHYSEVQLLNSQDHPYEIEDHLICGKDFQEMTEQLSTHFQKRVISDLTDINNEINYIMSNLPLKSTTNEKDLKDQILLILKKFLVEKLDIPYIMNYSKGFDPQLITIEDIQKILQLDLEYSYIKRRKQELMERISKCRARNKQHPSLNYIPFISELKTIYEVQDFDNYLNEIEKFISSKEMLTDSYDPNFNESNDFLRFLSSNIDTLADSFCLKTVDLCNSILHNENKMIPSNSIDPKNFPSHSNSLNEDYDQVVKFVAYDLANNFYIKSKFRNVWTNGTYVNTCPTPSGNEKMSIFHPFYRVKNIPRKPINTFKDDMILEIIYCTDNKLIHSNQSIDQKDINKFAISLKEKFMENPSDPKGWDIYRERIINTLMGDDLLRKCFTDQINTEIIKNANEYVKIECCKKFQEMLLENQYESPCRKKLVIGAKAEIVLSMIINPISKEIFYVFLDENGNSKDQDKIVFENINQFYIPSKFSIQEEVKTLIYKINRYYPKLIVIGANCINSHKLKSCLEFIINKKEDKDNKSFKTNVIFNNIIVILEKLEVPKFYAKEESIICKETNTMFNQAISLGRYIQDPSCEILNLISFDCEKSSFPLAFELHEKANMLDRMELIRDLKKVAINTICNLGIDLNNVAFYPHKQKVISHLLGKANANKIIDYIKNTGRIENLQILKKNLSKNQFDNYADYLLLNTENISIQNIDDLIKSRKLRPEFRDSILYFFESKQLPTIWEKNFEIFLKQKSSIFNPKTYGNDMLKALTDCGIQADIRIAENILSEIYNPNNFLKRKDKDQELFYKMINSNIHEFCKGSIITALVEKVEEEKMYLKLENGIEVQMLKSDFLDKEEMEKSLIDFISFGAKIKARIIDINYTEVICTLSSKMGDLIDNTPYFNNIKIDEFFVVLPEDLKNVGIQKVDEKNQKEYFLRIVNHDRFHNMNFQKAMEHLSIQSSGNYVFRPSSISNNNLTLTLKIADEAYVNYNIIELDKPSKTEIGKKLIIGNLAFKNISEISEKFIEKILQNINNCFKHSKYLQAKSIKDIDLYLNSESTKEPKYIHFCFSYLRQYPQFIVLSYTYKPPVNRHEFIRIDPDGYYFHEKNFNTLETFISWFISNLLTKEYQLLVKKYQTPPNYVQSTKLKSGKIVYSSNYLEEINNLENGLPKGSFLPSKEINNTELKQNKQMEMPGNANWNFKKEPDNQTQADHLINNEDHIENSWGNDNLIQNKSENMTSSINMQDKNLNQDNQKNANQKANNWGTNEKVENINQNQASWSSNLNNNSWGNENGQDNNNLNWNNNPVNPTNNDQSIENNKEKNSTQIQNNDSWGNAPSKLDSWGQINSNQGLANNNFNSDQNKRNSDSSMTCRYCKQEGHLISNCPKKKPRPEGSNKGCFKCGKEGHISKDCTEPSTARQPRPKICNNCGKEGHFQKECTEERKPRPEWKDKKELTCFNCGEKGHGKRECKNEKKDFKTESENGFPPSRGIRGPRRFRDRGRGWGSNGNDCQSNSFNQPLESGWGNNQTSQAIDNSWGAPSQAINSDQGNTNGWGCIDVNVSQKETKEEKKNELVDNSSWGVPESKDFNFKKNDSKQQDDKPSKAQNLETNNTEMNGWDTSDIQQKKPLNSSPLKNINQNEIYPKTEEFERKAVPSKQSYQSDYNNFNTIEKSDKKGPNDEEKKATEKDNTGWGNSISNELGKKSSEKKIIESKNLWGVEDSKEINTSLNLNDGWNNQNTNKVEITNAWGNQESSTNEWNIPQPSQDNFHNYSRGNERGNRFRENRGRGNERNEGRPPRSCFICKSTDHISSNCPQKKEGSGPPNGGACFKCNEMGHKSRDCPKNSQNNQGDRGRGRRGRFGNEFRGRSRDSNNRSSSSFNMPIESSNPANIWGEMNANSNSWGNPSENKIENQSNNGWGTNQVDNNVNVSSGWNIEAKNPNEKEGMQ